MSTAIERTTADPVAELIESVAPLAYQMAKKYAAAKGRREWGDDLAQALLLALTVAARRGTYDPAKGRPTTWAYQYGRYYLPRLLGELALLVHVPVGAVARANKLKGTRKEATDPIVQAVRRARGSLTQIDWHSTALHHSPANDIEASEERDRLARAVASLPERDRDIVASCFGLGGRPPETLERVGGRHGIGKERARQIRNARLKDLRKLLEDTDR